MLISVTSIKLKSLWKFFALSYNGLKISRQIKRYHGFIKMKNTGFGYMHYTMSVWKDEGSLKQFASEGAHLAAMKESRGLAEEIRTYTYHADTAPSWKEVKQLLSEKGKVLRFK